ncbi:MAG TPA: hypothetical protein VNW71_08300 [Thermoanaerobaculia bacterium]|nr:hypothetical protein [Thermoanaerobaculia bacterium]
MSASDTKGSTKQDSKKKGVAGSTSDDGKPKAGSGSGEPPPGDMRPKPK